MRCGWREHSPGVWMLDVDGDIRAFASHLPRIGTWDVLAWPDPHGQSVEGGYLHSTHHDAIAHAEAMLAQQEDAP